MPENHPDKLHTVTEEKLSDRLRENYLKCQQGELRNAPHEPASDTEIALASLNDRLNNLDGLLDRLERSLSIVLSDADVPPKVDEFGHGIPEGDGPTVLLRELDGLSRKASWLCSRLDGIGGRVSL